VRAAFEAVDRTRRGAIEPTDLRAALRRAGLAIDSDGAARVLEECYDGGEPINLIEFAKLVADIEAMVHANERRVLLPETPAGARRPLQGGAPPQPQPQPQQAPPLPPPPPSSGATGLPSHLEAELEKMAACGA